MLAVPYDVVVCPLLSRLLSFNDGLSLLLTCRTLYYHARVKSDFWARHLVVVRLNGSSDAQLELQWTLRFMRGLHRVLRSADGVSESSLAYIEAQLELRIPPDVRLFLRLGLPLQFAPFDRVDKYVAYAREEWGRNASPKGYEAYKLLPLYGRRMIPTVPCQAGNPVYFMHTCHASAMGDNITFGKNFFDWLVQEKFLTFDHVPEEVVSKDGAQDVPFWKDFLEENI